MSQTTTINNHNSSLGDLPTALTENSAPPSMTHREWLNLGVLCATAADKAEVEGNYSVALYYVALAKKCDSMTAELPRSARGTIPIPVEK